MTILKVQEEDKSERKKKKLWSYINKLKYS